MSTECETETLSQVLIFNPIPNLSEIQFQSLEKNYRFLKPFESPHIPIDEFLAANAASARVVLCFGPLPNVDARLLEKLPNLKCVVATSAGVNHIDLVECRKRGIGVCNAGEVFSDDVADYAVGLAVDVLRGVSAANRYVRSGLWPVNGEYRLVSKLGGKRVGIIGLGSIGSRVARRLEAFGCIIFYHSRSQKSSTSYKYFPNVCDLAAESDILITTCSLTSETCHIIDREVMLALGKDGVIINVGRGALIDEKELVKCLMEGEIGGVGLDVFENEPMVPKELFEMDNVVLSPHKAVFTPEAFSDLIQLVMDNLDAFFSGILIKDQSSMGHVVTQWKQVTTRRNWIGTHQITQWLDEIRPWCVHYGSWCMELHLLAADDASWCNSWTQGASSDVSGHASYTKARSVKSLDAGGASSSTRGTCGHVEDMELASGGATDPPKAGDSSLWRRDHRKGVSQTWAR